MTLKIFKYPLNVQTVNTVSAPIVKPLRVDFQNGTANLWAIVDTDAPDKTFQVLCIGTGQQVHFNINTIDYLNSTIIAEGRLVFHWFIRLPKEG